MGFVFVMRIDHGSDQGEALAQYITFIEGRTEEWVIGNQWLKTVKFVNTI